MLSDQDVKIAEILPNVKSYVVFEALRRCGHQARVIELEAMVSPLKRTDLAIPIS